MTRILLSLFLIVALVSCNQPVSNDNENNTEQPDSNLQPQTYDEEENPESDSLEMAYFDSQGVDMVVEDFDGIMLDKTFNLYDKDLNKTGQIKVDKLTPVKILQKTEKKPEEEGQDYCDWANYVQLIYNNDTITVFGANVLEIKSSQDVQLSSSTVSLILADDFTVGASDDEGLTGCDDFSYLIIKSGNTFSFINNAEASDVATFAHDEGMSEEIESITTKNDTIEAKVSVSHQDGGGEYDLKIFKDNNTWQFIKGEEVEDTY